MSPVSYVALPWKLEKCDCVCVRFCFFTVLFGNILDSYYKKANFDIVPCSEEEDQGVLESEEEEEIDVDSSVATVPAAPAPAAPAPAAPAPVVRGRARARARARARGGGGIRRGGADAAPDPGDVPYKSYRDPDVGNQVPEFKPTPPVGIHFGQPLLHHSMRKAIDFFNLFFTVEMINSICTHTNSYANQHIF